MGSEAGRVLLSLGFADGRAFDTSKEGQRVRTLGQIDTISETTAAVPADARITVAASKGLSDLESFTVETRVVVDELNKTQTLLRSPNPPLAIAVQTDGSITASVHTKDGWQELRSTSRLTKGAAADLRVTRDEKGTLRLELDGKAAGTLERAGELEAVGRGVVSIGADTDGSHGFAGSLERLVIREGAVSSAALKKQQKKALEISKGWKAVYKKAPLVILDRGSVDERFNHIKSIMHAAGVQDLSTVGTLRISEPTTLLPGTLLKAAAVPVVTTVDWGALAGTVRSGLRDGTDVHGTLNTNLLSSRTPRTLAKELTERTGEVGPEATISVFRRRVFDSGHPLLDKSDRLEALTPVEGLESLLKADPSLWPSATIAPVVVRNLQTIPVDAAVIIAKTLDLTNTTLEIDQAVGTLYIIAEEIHARHGARITWRRPPQSTPDRAPDPGLDGRDWNTQVGESGSRHGHHGGNGESGGQGIEGPRGVRAPNLEVWAKRAIGMPDIDLDGQDGTRGGRGQSGGRGGKGQRGRNGTWVWFFGAECWDHAGNGGDGGDGGDGGPGGRGGDGGGAGAVTLAVLPDTLAELTTSNAFSLKTEGGNPGQGGLGGAPGEGGQGGRRGASEDNCCTHSRDGSKGSRGSSGAEGQPGARGSDANTRILVVTEEAWDEQLTKPWVTQLTPSTAFPGTTLIVRGSRFADTDKVVFGATAVGATLRADGGLDVVLPTGTAGGTHNVFVRRHDGQESNRVRVTVRPQLETAPSTVAPGTAATVRGRAFLPGASVRFAGGLHPAESVSPTELTFRAPATGGVGAAATTVGIRVVNPDGEESNELTATQPRVLQSGFQVQRDDFKFKNFKAGTPSWSTFEDTFGALEVNHEIADPIFGHPILTAAYYAFYKHFLIGEDNGGLATGFCTSLASLALDRFWTGHVDTFDTVVKDDAFVRKATAVHGRLLSRETLITMHDQGRIGTPHVETTFRRIESAFASGGSRETAPLLFFIPSGAVWDAGYVDKLAETHCIVPIAITYPDGPDELDGAVIHCWDNNHPGSTDPKVVLRRTGGELRFDYFATASNTTKFRSEDGLTLGHMTLSEFYLSDHSLPFSGPFGLTSFVVDFLLSPATLRVADGNGRITGRVGGQVFSEIPDSHPGYLMPELYLLPSGTGLARRFTGTATGTYGFRSISAEGTSVSLDTVPTVTGQVDELGINADGTRIRFTPEAAKSPGLTLGRRVGQELRGLRFNGLAAGPGNELDVTLSPDMSLARIANNGPDAAVDVRLLHVNTESGSERAHDAGTVQVPSGKELVVAVDDWPQLGADSASVGAV